MSDSEFQGAHVPVRLAKTDPRDERVVVRNGLAGYGAGVIIGLLDLVFLSVVVATIHSGDPGYVIRDAYDPGPLAEVILWLIVGPITFGLTCLTMFVYTFREEFYSDRVRTRRLIAFKTLRLENIKSIQWGSARTSSVSSMPSSRLQIVGPHSSAFLNLGLVHYHEAMKVVDGWVRARPELVRGTNAERTFVGRGVLEPATQPGTESVTLPAAAGAVEEEASTPGFGSAADVADESRQVEKARPPLSRFSRWRRWQTGVLVVFVVFFGVMCLASSDWRDKHFGLDTVQATVTRVQPGNGDSSRDCRTSSSVKLSWIHDGDRHAGSYRVCGASIIQVGDKKKIYIYSSGKFSVDKPRSPWIEDLVFLIGAPIFVPWVISQARIMRRRGY